MSLYINISNNKIKYYLTIRLTYAKLLTSSIRRTGTKRQLQSTPCIAGNQPAIVEPVIAIRAEIYCI